MAASRSSNASASPTPRELLECHYKYEIDMLQHTYAYLGNGKYTNDTVIKNALIESFCIHARALMEFFEGKKERSTKKYVGGGYIPLTVKRRTRIHQLRGMLNNQIAHVIIDQRTYNQSGKIGDSEREELIKILGPKSQEFQANLKAECRSSSLPNITTIEITSTKAGATNVIAGAGTTTSAVVDLISTKPTGPTKPA